MAHTPKRPGEITVPELSREFGKAPSTIYRWIESGFILSLGYTIRRDFMGNLYLTPPRDASHASHPLPTI
jgi:hypothetical protein